MDRAVLNKLIEERYEELRGIVFASAYTLKLSKQDAEDAFQDLVVEILEQELDPNDWKKKAYTIVGRKRTENYREGQFRQKLHRYPPT